jgi:hypothetical protein
MRTKSRSKWVTLRLTVSQSVSLGVEPNVGLMTRYLLLFDSYGLILWGAFSHERTVLSFVYAAGPRQLRLPFPSPPTTRRVTVEVFEPASTRVLWESYGTDIYKLSSYLTGNTSRLRYRLMLFRETVTVYCENHTEHTDYYVDISA